MAPQYEPDRAYAEGVIAACAARGMSQKKVILRLLWNAAKEVIDSAIARNVDNVELVRRLLLRDRLANGYTNRQKGHGACGVHRMDESDDGIKLTWLAGRVLEYSRDRPPASAWLLDGVRITRTEAELQLGLWPGFLDGIELCEMNLRRLRRDAEMNLKLETARVLEELKQETRAERHRLLAKWRDGRTTISSGPVPHAIEHVRKIKRFDGVLACHVYFLLHEGVVVYVGQSGAAWPTRIESHFCDEEKDFDEIWYLEVDRPSLLDVERKFIAEFRPKYNKSGLRK